MNTPDSSPPFFENKMAKYKVYQATRASEQGSSLPDYFQKVWKKLYKGLNVADLKTRVLAEIHAEQ